MKKFILSMLITFLSIMQLYAQANSSLRFLKTNSSKNSLLSYNYQLATEAFFISETSKNHLIMGLAKKDTKKSINQNFKPQNERSMLTNRRLKYSSLWAFTCLNYLYADLVGVMDMNLLNQYQTGVVNGVEITPGFLTVAAAYMQLPLANVFLPHVIKNDRTLRWIQIISGGLATLIQGATLFVGKPAPYYVLFSAVEMGTTAFITIDAIKWKSKKKG